MGTCPPDDGVRVGIGFGVRVGVGLGVWGGVGFGVRIGVGLGLNGVCLVTAVEFIG